jgi:membrane-associated protein
MHFSPIIDTALNLSGFIKYPLLFIGAAIEGPILIIASGFLLHLGYFSFFPLFFALMLGDLAGDIVWYYIGEYFMDGFVRRFGKFFSITPEIVTKVKELFTKYHERILFISKITLGFGMSLGTLMVAGATRVKMSKFILLNFLGEFVIVGILLTVGYLFGQLYAQINQGFKVAFLIGAALLTGGMVFGFANYTKQKAKEL